MSNELFMGGTRLYARDQADLQKLAADTEYTRQRTRNEAADAAANAQLNPLREQLLRGQAEHQGTMAELNRAQTSHQGVLSDLSRAQIDHQGALSDYSRARASEVLSRVSREDRVAATVAAALGKKKAAAFPQFDDEGNPMPPVDDGTTSITDLAGLGQTYIEAGDLPKGEKLIRLAADLEKSKAATRASEASEVVRKTNAEVKKLEFMRQVFSGVTDQASHARALLLLQGNSLTADEQVPKGLQTYDPKMISQFLAGSKTALDKKRADILAFNAGSADQARKAAQTTREYLAGLAKERTTAYVERAGAITKTGDEKSVPAPNGAEIKLMRQELAEEDIEFDEDDPAAVAELAEQAKILYTRNPSVSRAAAAATVIGDAKKRGDLVSGEKRWYAPDKKAKYNQSEGTVAMPLPLPASRAELVPGNYYRGPDGRVEKWTGSGGEPVSKRVAKPGK